MNKYDHFGVFVIDFYILYYSNDLYYYDERYMYIPERPGFTQYVYIDAAFLDPLL